MRFYSFHQYIILYDSFSPVFTLSPIFAFSLIRPFTFSRPLAFSHINKYPSPAWDLEAMLVDKGTASKLMTAIFDFLSRDLDLN